MSDLSLPGPHDVTLFVPEQTRAKVAHLDGDIITFRKLQQWPKLEEAAQEKVAEIAAFVANWDECVRPNHRPETNTAAHYLSVAEAEAKWQIAQPTVSRWRGWLRDTGAFLERIILGVHRKALLEVEPNRQSPNSGEEEWYTPAEYIAAAREVMGGIDLDPASSAEAQQGVQATQWFSREDDGLSLSWHGRVWLNPPYSYPAIEQFTAKLCTEFADGAVDQAIMVVNNCTDTGWFHATEAVATLLCFTRGRIRFYGPGSGDSPLQGQCFFYFGDRHEEFRRIFSRVGFVVAPCDICDREPLRGLVG
jgi:phage N-6-adenine-methyltransferase